MNVVREHSHHAVAGFFMALVLAGADGCARRAEAVARTGPPHPQVTVAEPVVASVAEFSEHTGRTEAPGTVEIRARASGYLLRAAFHEGDVVKKGALLFVIDPRPYQAVLARVKADLLSVRADHELAKKNAARAEQLF